MAQAIDTTLDVLARQGGNDKVIDKKVLLAHLAKAESRRLGITPGTENVQRLAEQYCHELGLQDTPSLQNWLQDAGISEGEFHAVIEDFAAVLAVEAYYRDGLARHIGLHQRVVTARNQQLSKKNPLR